MRLKGKYDANILKEFWHIDVRNEELEKLAEDLVGKPVMRHGKQIGKVVFAERVENGIEFEAEIKHEEGEA